MSAAALVAPKTSSGMTMRRKVIVGASALLFTVALVAVVTSSGPQGTLLAGHFGDQARYPQDIYLYDDGGKHSQETTDDVAKFLKYHHLATNVHIFSSLASNVVRSIVWNPNNHVLVFPRGHEYPSFDPTTRTDLRAFVGRGNVMVFLGDYKNIDVINDLFDTHMHGLYAHGPYYRNDRTVRGTPFEYGWSHLQDLEPIGTVGINSQTFPLAGRSLYDTQGSSVAMYFKYGNGAVVFLGSGYTQWVNRRDGWVNALHAAVRM